MSIISGANAVTGAGAVSYQIERSLRFNSADSAYLSRAVSTTGNRQKWTYSGWVKKSTSTATNIDVMLFGSGPGNSTTMTQIRLNDGNGGWTLWMGSYNGSGYDFQTQTTALFRDPSAWYHIVVAVDTTQATAADRVKFYSNGVLQARDSSNPSLNYNTYVNLSSYNNYIGAYAYNVATTTNGYMTEIHFIDGSALDPTSFGEYNTDTGVWQPKAYTGSYGTNGFYLDFADNSSTTALGYDAAGSNDWTPNNFSVTAGAGNDSLVDTPTPYGTDTGVGGEVRGNYATLNPNFVVPSTTFSNGNLQLTKTGNVDIVAASTLAVSSGKWYWEVTPTTLSSGSNFGGGIVKITSTNGSWVGGLPNGVFFGGGNPGNVYRYGTALSNNNMGASAGDVISFALDMDNGTLTVKKNNASVTNGTITGVDTTTPHYVFVNTYGSGEVIQANFGQRPFAYTAPSGFKALCTQNLPEPTVVDGGEYFNAVLYTGTGSARSVTGVGFQPDFTWLKERSNARNHYLYDSVRGALKELYSNLTSAESTNTIGLSAFDTDGFTINSGDNAFNGTGNTYVAWNWKAGGTGVTNTAGTITGTVTVSANTTAGFSIVTYTGTGSGTPTVGHGLGVAPSMIIIKSRSNAVNWGVGHVSAGWSNAGLLNATNSFGGSSYFASTAPTSTVFSIQDTSVTNIGGATYVAYCFAPVAGYSAFGSYTGNGSSDGPFVYTGHRPRWIMVKSSSAAVSGWVIYDTVRSTYNVVTQRLFANSSAAQDTGLQFDILSNGFKVREAGGQGNDSGVTYIYAAFAENPFKYALAR